MNCFLRSTGVSIHKIFKRTIGFLTESSKHSATRSFNSSSSKKYEVEVLKTAHHSLEIKPLADKETNWPLLLDTWYHYHENAPTCAGVRGFRSPEGRALLKLSLRDMVLSADCPVVIAWDTEKKKVAAMCIHHVERRDEQHIAYHEKPGTFKYENHVWPEEIKRDITLLKRFYEHNLTGKLEFFNRYEVDACWTPSPLSVLPEYTDQNIGLRTSLYGLGIARRMGFKMAKVMSESTYTQQMARGKGFKTIVECNYKSEFQLYHQMPERVRKRHKSCMAMVKEL